MIPSLFLYIQILIANLFSIVIEFTTLLNSEQIING